MLLREVTGDSQSMIAYPLFCCCWGGGEELLTSYWSLGLFSNQDNYVVRSHWFVYGHPLSCFRYRS